MSYKQHRLVSLVRTACQIPHDSSLDADADRVKTVMAHINAMQSSTAVKYWDHIALWGFGDVKRRNALLRVLRRAWRARVVHASHVNAGQFEIFMSAPVDVSQLGDFLDLFNMGLDGMSVLSGERGQWRGCTEVGLKCIERIDKGTRLYGNWTSKIARPTWSRYEVLRARRDEQAAKQKVLMQSGMEFTPDNMLRLYNMNQALRSAHESMHTALNSVSSQLDFEINFMYDNQRISLLAFEQFKLISHMLNILKAQSQVLVETLTP